MNIKEQNILREVILGAAYNCNRNVFPTYMKWYKKTFPTLDVDTIEDTICNMNRKKNLKEADAKSNSQFSVDLTKKIQPYFDASLKNTANEMGYNLSIVNETGYDLKLSDISLELKLTTNKDNTTWTGCTNQEKTADYYLLIRYLFSNSKFTELAAWAFPINKELFSIQEIEKERQKKITKSVDKKKIITRLSIQICIEDFDDIICLVGSKRKKSKYVGQTFKKLS